MSANFHIVSYKDYPLIPDKKNPLPINVSVSDIRYQLVLDADDDIKCEELLLVWRAKPNCQPNKQNSPRWFYVDELIPFADDSSKVAAIQYKGHTKHKKLAFADSRMLKVNLHEALASDLYSELLPSNALWKLKEHRDLSSKLADDLVQKYQVELDEYTDSTNINGANIEQQLADLNRDFTKIDNGYQITVADHNIQLLWEEDLPNYEHPAQLKVWAKELGDDTISYIDLFNNGEFEGLDWDKGYDDLNGRFSDLLISQPEQIEHSLDLCRVHINSGAIGRVVWVIRMDDSDRALVAAVDLLHK